MPSIFISYTHHNEAIVKTLAADIELLGYTVWFDQELTGGQTWWDQILVKIRDCDVFILILDSMTLNSTACKREYNYAADLGKSILPVLIAEDISTNLLPPALSQIQFVDYCKQDRTAVLRLVRALTTVPLHKPLPDPLPLPPEVPISYLGRLAEQIETPSILDYEKQSILVVDLKGSLRDPETAKDVPILLRKLRKRHDLLAVIAEEIDELLRGIGKASSAPPHISQPELSSQVSSSEISYSQQSQRKKQSPETQSPQRPATQPDLFRDRRAFAWALTFLVIAIIAALFGFSGVAGMATNIAWILFVVGLILFVVFLIISRRSLSI